MEGPAPVQASTAGASGMLFTAAKAWYSRPLRELDRGARVVEKANSTTGGPHRGVRKWSSGCWSIAVIAGLDEAGRGLSPVQLSQPAVLLLRRCRLPGLNDSKQIAESERNRLFAEIVHRATGVGIGAANGGGDRPTEYSPGIPSCDASGAGCTSGQTGLSVARRRVLPGYPFLSVPSSRATGSPVRSRPHPLSRR